MGGGSARKLQQGTIDHSCLWLRLVLTHPALPILILPGQIVPVWLLVSAFGSCPNDDRVRYFFLSLSSPSPPPPLSEMHRVVFRFFHLVCPVDSRLLNFPLLWLHRFAVLCPGSGMRRRRGLDGMSSKASARGRSEGTGDSS